MTVGNAATEEHKNLEQAQFVERFSRAVSMLFGFLGRALICLDGEFRVLHVSSSLDQIVGHGAQAAIMGLPIEEVLGSELFGAQGTLRRALVAGERREGWGAAFAFPGLPEHMLSLSAAPVHDMDTTLCDPNVAFIVVVRSGASAPPSDAARVTLFGGMVARSGVMRRIFDLVRSLSESDATVLLTGESGTGKELVARALHQHSPRHAGPFVAVNCGALPGELLESELFGHVRGAFTGAVRDRQGRFELARGGTLFLDEVADLTLPLQVKLLRVLQERTFERVGESTSRDSDARIIAATNRDLHREVREGRFRDDLYYRLRVVPISIPPLRDRREDVEPLALHLLARVAGRQDRSLLLSPEALRVVLQYHWPGNAREIENALEYAVAVCRGQTILAHDLPVEVLEPHAEPDPLVADAPPRPEDAAEFDVIRRTLERHRWNRVETAAELGMSRTTLWRRMRELGLGR